MKPMNDRTQLGQPRPASAPASRNRFRIEKLEERIAPGRYGGHYNPQTKWVGKTYDSYFSCS
jgi:hypothetical protein